MATAASAAASSSGQPHTLAASPTALLCDHRAATPLPPPRTARAQPSASRAALLLAPSPPLGLPHHQLSSLSLLAQLGLLLLSQPAASSRSLFFFLFFSFSLFSFCLLLWAASPLLLSPRTTSSITSLLFPSPWPRSRHASIVLLHLRLSRSNLTLQLLLRLAASSSALSLSLSLSLSCSLCCLRSSLRPPSRLAFTVSPGRFATSPPLLFFSFSSPLCCPLLQPCCSFSSTSSP